MSKEQTLSGYIKLKKFLESTFVHYTATDIYDFFKKYNIDSSKGQLFTKSTIRTYLKVLASADKTIQVQDIPGKRDNYYIALTNPEEKYINLEIVGLWLQHYDASNLLDCVKERLKDPSLRYSPVPTKENGKSTYEVEYPEISEDVLMDSQSLENVAFFQGVGMINYHDIPKIVGINPYRRYPDGSPPVGIQRPKDLKWIKELKNGLSVKYSAMLTTSILYFNIEDIEVVASPIQRDDGLLSWKIKIPYKEHIFDNDKPGMILDGQQRMWALDLMNLERTYVEGKPSIPFYGPTTVLIGDFKGNSKYEFEIIRMYFITSNETRNLPKTLKQELSALMNSEVYEALPSNIKFRGAIEDMVNKLDEDEISPFYHEIDHEVKSFNKLGKILEIEGGKKIRMFSRKGIYDMIEMIIQGNPFNYNKLEDIQNKTETWLDIIIDYFNAIKCVFNSDWEDNDSVIKRNIVINALGMLISPMWSSHLNRMKRDDRIKELIQDFARWRDFDENLDFSRHSDINSKFPKELKRNIKALYNLLMPKWNDSTMETEESDEMEDLIAEFLANWEIIKVQAETRKDKKYEK